MRQHGRNGKPGVIAVARAAGVSPSTVSNVYNQPHVVSPELRERVRRAATQLGYGGGDPLARSLRSGRASAIGVVIRERLAYSFDDPATVRLLQGVSDAADPHQLALVIVPAYPEKGTTDGPAVRHAAVDGLILSSRPPAGATCPQWSSTRPPVESPPRPRGLTSSASTSRPPPKPPSDTSSTSVTAVSPS